MDAHGNTFTGSLLIAGTTIGGAMLAMPVYTSIGGFGPSIAMFILCWLFMAATGLLFLEVCMWMGEDTNMVSMAEKTLGKWGKYFAWGMYLFLFFSLSLAYVAGAGKMFWSLFQGTIPLWGGPVLFLLIFGPMVYIGARLIGKVNVFLMIGLAVSYFAFVFIGFRYVNTDFLADGNWGGSLKILPVAFTAFGFQGTVPTLVRYLNFDKKKIRDSILIGSFIPLLTYIVWHWLILGIVPREGDRSLMEALVNGDSAVQPLKYFLQNPYIFLIGESFAFFAIVTSFLGVNLGLRDFLADGLQIEKNKRGRLLVCLMIFIPVVLGAILYPNIFIEALGYAGGYGCALLLGALPILMVWSGRYKMGLKNEKVLPGGKTLLILMLLFVALEVTVETLHLYQL